MFCNIRVLTITIWLEVGGNQRLLKGVWESHNGILMAIHRLFISLEPEEGWKALFEWLGAVKPFALKGRGWCKSDNKPELFFKHSVSHNTAKQAVISHSCRLILEVRMKHFYPVIQYDELLSRPLQGRGFRMYFHFYMIAKEGIDY